MNLPKMVLFDYGGTLMYEPDFEPAAGNRAIYPHIVKNPHGISVEEFSEYLLKLFDEIKALRGDLIEIHEHTFLRYVLQHFDMELDCSTEEAEWIIWNGVTQAVPIPGAAEMLAYLHENHIRTGVISNLCWSGAALTRRLQAAFPSHPFEFILVSSENIFRKPDWHIFDLAIRRSGLQPEEIWFCGNDVAADIFGSQNARMFPVYYDDRTVPSSLYARNDELMIDFPHLHLHRWEELPQILQKGGAP